MPGQERTRALVRDLLAEPAEQPWLEFKGNNVDPQVIGKTIAAISNGAAIAGKPAGHILWGIEDVLHAIEGTTFDPDQTCIGNQPLHIWLTQKVVPNPVPQFASIELDGRRVVIAEVRAASASPIKFDGHAYVRIGSSTTRLSDHPEVERQLWSKLQSFAWESVTLSDYVPAVDVFRLLDHRSFFERLDLPPADSEGTILERLAAENLIEADVGGHWKILNLGAILIATDLSQFARLARKAVRVIQYAGKDKQET